MATTLQKWGNSLGIRIPKTIAEQLHLKTGTMVELDATAGVLTIRPTRRRHKQKLSALLSQFKPRHRHGEIHADGPRGAEIL